MSAGWIAFCIIMSYILLLCFIVYIGINLKTNKVMKELSNEDKAKRYDEALHKAKRIINVCVDDNTECRSMIACIQQIFPELKESEDERILKQLRDFFKNHINSVYEEIDDNNDVLNWLEKQNEQKHTDKVEPKFKIGDNIEPIDSCLGSLLTIYKNCDGFYETNQGTLDFEFENNWRLTEQKSAWSEEDETKIKSIIALLKSPALCTMDGNKGIIDESIKYLKSLKDRVQPRKEWSKEDEKIVEHLINLYKVNLKVNHYPDLEVNKKVNELRIFFKSIRPQNRWKPSDEHYGLEEFAKIVRCNLTGISKAVQALFEAKYLQLTGNKMYGGFKD